MAVIQVGAVTIVSGDVETTGDQPFWEHTEDSDSSSTTHPYPIEEGETFAEATFVAGSTFGSENVVHLCVFMEEITIG